MSGLPDELHMRCTSIAKRKGKDEYLRTGRYVDWAIHSAVMEVAELAVEYERKRLMALVCVVCGEPADSDCCNYSTQGPITRAEYERRNPPAIVGSVK